MENLHRKISENNLWYRNWHTRDSYVLIHWLTFILIILLTWNSLDEKIYNGLNEISGQRVVFSLTTNQTIISLDPKIKTVKVGETFEVNIILNTKNEPIDGVDIYSLHYDPSILKVVDAIPNQNGTQIKPGTILPNSAANIVNESAGTIKLAQVSLGGESFNGVGTLATINFKAVGTGISLLKFDFDRGSTIDTNAAHKGRDRLANAVDAIYTVNAN